jgi:predicted DNA-binding transcriptional regulator AlpA
MGRQPPSDYVDKVEAAKTLGVSVRTLDNMIHKNMIVPHSFAGSRKVVFLRSDVSALMQATGDGGLDLAQVKALALAALSTSRRNEQRMVELYAHLGMELLPLARDTHSVRSLYEEVKLGVEPSSVHDADWLQFWTNTFFSMDEVYLELVTHLTGDVEPWLVFHDLANAILRELDSYGLTRPVRIFRASRNHLRHVSYMHCRRVKGVETAGIVFDGRARAVDELNALIG